MKPALLGVAVLLLLSALGGLAVAQSSSTARENVYAELAKVPEKARNKPNPLGRDAEAVTAGGLLYERHCRECHGQKAEGKKGPSLFAREVQTATPGALFWVLTNGVVRKGMPVWSKLPEAQRWQIVAFIKSLKKTETPERAEDDGRSTGASPPR
jgi:mono/diheme cytochrome c family protein